MGVLIPHSARGGSHFSLFTFSFQWHAKFYMSCRGVRRECHHVLSEIKRITRLEECSLTSSTLFLFEYIFLSLQQTPRKNP